MTERCQAAPRAAGPARRVPGNLRAGRPRAFPIPPFRTRPARPLRAALPAVLLAACELPTDIPNWEQRWIVAGDSTAMSVDRLLPSSVTPTADRSAFAVNVDGVDFRQSLGAMCAGCRPLQGAVAPKPAFDFRFADSVRLPDQVAAVTLVAGGVEVRLSHSFSFDPLRPSATARGRLIASLLHGGSTLASVTIRGEDESFPPNTPKIRTLALPSGTSIAGPIRVEVSIESPAGDPARIDTAAVLDVRAAPRDIRVSEARVRVQDKRVDVDAVQVDLQDVEPTIRNRVEGGAFVFELANPFPITGTLELRIQAGGRLITKSLSVSPGPSTQRVSFSRDELRAMFGNRNLMSASGPVSAAGGVVAVRPNQILVVKTTIDFLLRIKES